MEEFIDEMGEGGLPKHLFIPVDKWYRGPVPSKTAAMWICWCAKGKDCDVIRPTTKRPTMKPVILENSAEELHNVHLETQCEGRLCPIHNRSNHPMRSFPQHWRADTGVMERICPHGIGHPDPDGYVYLVERFGEREAAAKFVHGCDGCGHGPDDDAIFDILREEGDEY